MPKCWLTLPFFLLAALTVASGQKVENTAIVRTVELGGSVVHVTTTYAIRSLEDELKSYTIALARGDKSKTSWLEATIKGQKTSLAIKERAVHGDNEYQLFDVALPKALSVNKTLSIVFDTIQTHATEAWPAIAGQNDEQALRYMTDVFVLSPYPTTVQRTKIKSQTPRVISFTEPKNIESFAASASAVSKSGATVVYGPFNNLPPSTTDEFIEKYQQPVNVHYYHDQPVLEILKLKRSVEISHWGANLNTQDEIVLYNAGPRLKGHFSRLDHQTQQFYKRPAPHILPALTLHLPSGIRNAYYYDTIGNVSTSKLRTAPSVPKNRQGTQFSVLEFKPRYPLLGGWNYSFTLGWDAPLEDSTSYDKDTGRFIVEVPIMTPILGAVVDDEELTVVLPEGATDVQFAVPFPASSTLQETHKTYLDTTGRPALTFKYKDLTVKQAESIFVSYKVSWSAHLKKPVAVGTASLGLFILGMISRRVNLTLHQKSKMS
ncbi:oligosaccharyl transferase alpha subunit [Gymnopilus junonius]|uniref:Dolichyl-diphosphooligosaccharide--protein glycosyltransferase subunit 1 n=1 Tax=Gymnopilus junonius TaxID=109634 RepID=A0A9P5TUS8_GYMJU|nr:oligosaccharyl transferase alpha subunit [Gymnopilus junonius]